VGIDLMTEQLTIRNPGGGASTPENDEYIFIVPWKYL
jgi:hypothetical protein